ncbi:GntR family transcriptional regulator [Modestobacter sp. KNN46-3]|uniref:GntR family transcriptional regulator n=1 Tax=Modestobacter sp. KNN46-3 TaxID=2711218 RepID=UPI0013E05477|nr:GntR family transcriptional regulator [Modestobacter sp. KNN46-3]
MNEDAGPIFRQVATQLEDAIVDGSLAEESQAPSSNELAAFHRINPATAAKGLNQLVADGVLYKRRGVGMFVATGAREQLLKRRRSEFACSEVETSVSAVCPRKRMVTPSSVAATVTTGLPARAAAGRSRRC